MRLARMCVLALALFAMFSPSTTRAQGSATLDVGGMDLHLFRPAIDSKGHLTVNGSDVLGHMDFSFGLVLDVGLGILPFDGYEDDNAVSFDRAELTDRIVSQAFTGTLHGNIGLFNQLVVGLQVPISIMNGPNVQIPGVYNFGTNGLGYQSIGDMTVHGKWRISRAERDPIGMAAVLRVQLPTGDPASFAGEPGFSLWPSFVAEWRPHRRVRVSLEPGVRLSFGEGAVFPVGGATEPMDTSTAVNATLTDPGTDLEYGSLLTLGLGASFRVLDSLDIVLEGYGTQVLSAFGNSASLSAEALIGLKIFVDRNSFLMVGGGIGLPLGGFQSADYRMTLGFIFEPSIGDRDGDGYKDDVDQCPDEPEDFDDFSDEDGCPDPDNDRDGILDVDDACPLVPEDRDGEMDEDGCPEGNEGDRDGDGILDEVDECPDDPEDRDNFQDEDGCPDPDNDDDGILDPDDLCPVDPEDADEFEDQDGCPDLDNDNDRILDVDDGCPVDPESYNGFEDEDGCPDRGTVILEDNSLIILEKIFFETDSAVILERSYPIIEAVAATLNGNPQITMIEIQGHADERCDDDHNLRLTRDRAASVTEAIVQRGVSRDRLRSAGYGERCPIDPRSNRTAWEANRRVEFKIIATDQGPTGVEVVCPAGRDLIPQ